MEKTDKNIQLNLLLQIAKELIHEGKTNSFRDFSSKYLNRCSNYLGTLIYQNKPPSIASLLKTIKSPFNFTCKTRVSKLWFRFYPILTLPLYNNSKY